MEEPTKKKREKHIYYTLDYNKTVRETMHEIVKLTLPITFTMAKLKADAVYNEKNNKFKIYGVEIQPLDEYGEYYRVQRTENMGKIKIVVGGEALWEYNGRFNLKRTIPIKKGIIDITQLKRMFEFVNETRKKAEEDLRIKKEQRAKNAKARREYNKKAETFKNSLSLPKNCYATHDIASSDDLQNEPNNFNIYFQRLTQKDCLRLVEIIKDFVPQKEGG